MSCAEGWWWTGSLRLLFRGARKFPSPLLEIGQSCFLAGGGTKVPSATGGCCEAEAPHPPPPSQHYPLLPRSILLRPNLVPAGGQYPRPGGLYCGARCGFASAPNCRPATEGFWLGRVGSVAANRTLLGLRPPLALAAQPVYGSHVGECVWWVNRCALACTT